MLEKNVYPYGEDFQTQVLSLCLREPNFLPSYSEIIHADYFDSEVHSALARMTFDYYYENNDIPTFSDMKFIVSDYCSESHVDDRFREHMLNVLNDVYDIDISKNKFVRDKVLKFGQIKVMERMTLEMASMLNVDTEPDLIWEKIDQYRQKGSQKITSGINVGDVFLDAVKYFTNDSLYGSEYKVQTGFPSLDAAFSGGPGKREVGIVLGSTGGGKSAMLINLGANAVRTYMPVLHISIGELEEADIVARYTANWTGFPISAIVKGEVTESFAEEASMFREKYNPSVIAKYFPPFTTVSTLRNYISRMKYRMGIPPQLILIDNADDLTPGAGVKSNGDAFEDLGKVYMGLKDIAHDFDVVIWGDSQTNRYGLSKEVIGTDVIASSYKKATKADIIISVNQNEDEYKNKEMRLFVAKARRYGNKTQLIKCKADLSLMRITEII